MMRKSDFRRPQGPALQPESVRFAPRAFAAPRLRVPGTPVPDVPRPIQRKEITGLPGIGTIDTASYTLAELLIIQQQIPEGDVGKKPATDLAQAIDEEDYKDAPGPGAEINGIGIAGHDLVKFLPVNLFQIAHRLSPREALQLGVLLKSGIKGLAPLVVRVEGSGGENGTASLDGTDMATLNGSAGFTLRGLTQTSPGNANQLVVTIWKERSEDAGGNVLLMRSGRFSVAAAPVNWQLEGKQDLAGEYMEEFGGTFWGLTVIETWESDSGALSDLDEVDVDERVELVTANGIYEGQQVGVRAPTPGVNETEALDDHGVGEHLLTGPGEKEIHQVHVYNDRRTGAVGAPIENSGYKITQTVTEGDATDRGAYIETEYTITTKKEGAAVTVDGIYSDAGQGSQENELQTTRRRYKITKKISKGGGRGKGFGRGGGRAGGKGKGRGRGQGRGQVPIW